MDWDAVLKTWNEEIAPIWKLPVLRKLTDLRKAHVLQRLQGNPDLWADLKTEIPKMKEELALGGWFNFDWIMKSENNLTKLLEGNYRKNGTEKKTFTPEYHRCNGKEIDYWNKRYAARGIKGHDPEEGVPLPRVTDDYDIPF